MRAKDFINNIDNKTYQRIRKSNGDAECRRYLLERLDDLTPSSNFIRGRHWLDIEDSGTEVN